MFGRPPTLMAPARELAEDIQDGATVEVLAVRLGVGERAIMGRLREAGYDWNTGLPVGRKPADPGERPLVASAGGSGNHVGGGDNPNGLPERTVYRQPRPKPTGLDWGALRPPGEPARSGPVAVELINGHTYAIPDTMPRRELPGKLSPEQRSEVCRRYLAGESATALGRAFAVTAPSIVRLLRKRGIEIRNRTIATRLAKGLPANDAEVLR